MLMGSGESSLAHGEITLQTILKRKNSGRYSENAWRKCPGGWQTCSLFVNSKDSKPRRSVI
jgi:hypothetical protein